MKKTSINKKTDIEYWPMTKENYLNESSNNVWAVSDDVLGANKRTKWRDLSKRGKYLRVLKYVFLITSLLITLFGFICCLSLLADSLKLIGGRGLGKFIKNSVIVQNPISASIIGMVATIILQNSSTLNSILIGMIAGSLITVHQAIPMMIGAEMGGSLTNALISLTQVRHRDQFRRAFAAVTLNDVFNFLCYFIFIPIEMGTGFIEKISYLLVKPLSGIHSKDIVTLNLLTDPVLHFIVQVDDEAINKFALDNKHGTNTTMDSSVTFIDRCIDMDTYNERSRCAYRHIFAYSTWSDMAIGIILLVVALLAIFVFMFAIVKLMEHLFAGNEVLIRRIVSSNLPKPFTFLTDYLLIVVGCIIVIIMRSSSVFRTILTPLVGIGVVSLQKLYPLILGGNIGTTFTATLAALAADPAKITQTLQMALAQTTYNVVGVLLFYPIPFMRAIPIHLAKKLGNIVAKYRWFAFIYIAFIFIILPGVMLGLSFLPQVYMFTILGILAIVICLLFLVNFMQVRFPKYLPKILRNWEFLPLYMRSLRPYDKFMVRTCSKISCCRRCFREKPMSHTEESSVES